MTMNFYEIEKKWQKYWEEKEVYKAVFDRSKQKYYVLEMFPYPSGQLHMGHARNYVLGDAIARYKILRGYKVLHPIGWDAFGLPAENAAIKHKIHPKIWTDNNIKTMKEQLKKLGISYDWSREIDTSKPEYYKFTQWMFLKLYENNLAYRKKGLVNWCDNCSTVLANEQVIDGKCWRCHNLVSKKELEQWYIKITKYADSLLEELDRLEGWSDNVKLMQRNWIGKSKGARIKFFIPDFDEFIEVFTTRADTLPGVTFVALAVEHPLVEKIIQRTNNEKLKSFVIKVKSLTNIDRSKEKEGIFSGFFAENPLDGNKVPIWVTNYVLMDYGTGAVMGVPAHDSRDYEFAKKYNLPIIPVILSYEAESVAEFFESTTGKMFNVKEIDGINVNNMDCNDFRVFVIKYLESKGFAKEEVNYRLRDWLISRQRYWGAPIPIIYCDNCGIVPVPYEELPVLLPDNVDITGKGESPLKYCPEFVNVKCYKCGSQARRETDTMDTFMCSSWYFYRYTSVYEKDHPFNKEELNYWLPVDQYIGGIEHAVLHLLYSRFLAHFLYDQKMINFKEPFVNLLNQGMVCKDGKAMSKSLGNIVSIEEVLEKYSADTGRVFELFVAPPEKDIEWSDKGIEGAFKFLNRYFAFCKKIIDSLHSYNKEIDQELKYDLFSVVYKTLKKITDEFETRRYHFNTCIASMMELLNFLEDRRDLVLNLSDNEKQEILDILIKIISPFAPHLAEELNNLMGNKNSLFEVSGDVWPKLREEFLIDQFLTIPVQLNGKLRGQVKVKRDSSQDVVLEHIKSDNKLFNYLKNKEIKKIVFVKNKIINIIVNDKVTV